jgi:ribosome-associated toxin RatA of RatAB toxin-antitoxin module
MRSVEIIAVVPEIDLGTAFATISDFGRYPALVPDVVRSVTVEPAGPGEPVVSAWEVFFRNGILSWTEVDVLHPETATIDFEQTVGDFEEFSGGWRLTPFVGSGTAGVRVVFAAEFDFGVPSLASIVDPVAERVLVETITEILRGLFGTVLTLAGSDGARPPAGSPVVVADLPASGHPRSYPALRDIG